MRKRYLVLSLLVLSLLAACGIGKNAQDDHFYNRKNELRVKSKDGLFSSKTIRFGDFSTSEKDKGVDKNVISFKTQRSPFHFTLKGDENNTSYIQAVYTQEDNLKDKNLPDIFDDDQYLEMFYAFISGGSFSTLKNWELIVKNPTYEELNRGDQTGVLQSPTDVIAVHAHNRFGTKNSYENICYEFRLSGVVVGAVQVNGSNKVWLDKNLNKETRFAIASAIASLLMK